MFKVGDPVWVYDAPGRPYVGTVIAANEFSVYCRTDNKYMSEKAWPNFQVFKRPEDKDRLIEQMANDSEKLARYANDLKEAM